MKPKEKQSERYESRVLSGDDISEIINVHNSTIFNSGNPPWLHDWKTDLVENNIELMREALSDDSVDNDEKSSKLLSAQQSNINIKLDSMMEEIKRLHEDHLSFEKQINDLNEKVADKESIINSKVEIINTISQESQTIKKELGDKIAGLKETLSLYLPHMRVFRTALYSALFFVGCFLLNFFGDILVITPFWNFLGLTISLGFLVMAYTLYLDWKKTDDVK